MSKIDTRALPFYNASLITKKQKAVEFVTVTPGPFRLKPSYTSLQLSHPFIKISLFELPSAKIYRHVLCSLLCFFKTYFSHWILLSLPPSLCLLYTFCRYYQGAARNVVHLKSENLGFANNYALRQEYVLALVYWTCSLPTEETSPGTTLSTRCWPKARWRGCRWCLRARSWRSTSTLGLWFQAGLCVFVLVWLACLKLDPCFDLTPGLTHQFWVLKAKPMRIL